MHVCMIACHTCELSLAFYFIFLLFIYVKMGYEVRVDISNHSNEDNIKVFDSQRKLYMFIICLLTPKHELDYQFLLTQS